MGISIEMRRMSIKEMYESFLKETKIKDTIENKELFVFVLKLHGIVFEDTVIILNNELYEDWNLFYQLETNLLKAFDFLDYEVESRYDLETEKDIPELFLNVILKNNEYSIADIEVNNPYEIPEKIKEYKEKRNVSS